MMMGNGYKWSVVCEYKDKDSFSFQPIFQKKIMDEQFSKNI